MISDSSVIVPTGGLGTRLAPFTDNLSKAQVPFINYFPNIELVFYGFARNLGVKQFVFGTKGFVNYRDNKSYFEGGFGWSAKLGLTPPVEFEYQNPHYEDEGNADSILYSIKEFGIDHPVIVVFCDQLYSMKDVLNLYDFTMKSKFGFGMALMKADEPSLYGIVELGKDGEIRSYVEKPAKGTEKSNLANGGIYVLKPEVFDQLEGDFSKNTIPKLTEKGRVKVTKNT